MSMLQTVLDYVGRCNPAELKSLAQRSGIPVHTIIKLRNGQTADPRISTLEPLHFVITGGLNRRRSKRVERNHPSAESRAFDAEGAALMLPHDSAGGQGT